MRKIFPIKTDTACQLKWVWSTIYLTTGMTASCHRTDHHPFDVESFNFHNTERKIKDRRKMLYGQWPTSGCEYCRDVEEAGGISDRIVNLTSHEFDPPVELQQDLSATEVTPRLLEIYFNNTCNLKCTYCGPFFSSLWNDELIRFGDTGFVIDKNFEANKQQCFNWLRNNIQELHQLNVLGGEPLYQKEFDELLDVLEETPAPDLTLTFFSNLAVAQDKLIDKIDRIQRLIEQGKIKKLIITASLDCWGDEQEFARFPLKLSTWEQNFNYLLAKEWIILTIGSTITPLTIKTLHVLMNKIKTWNEVRPVHWYGNSIKEPNILTMDMFGDVFNDDFNKALELMPETFPEHIGAKQMLDGIRIQVKMSKPDLTKIGNLYIFLNTMDKRRKTSWRTVYPWLQDLFQQHLTKVQLLGVNNETTI